MSARDAIERALYSFNIDYGSEEATDELIDTIIEELDKEWDIELAKLRGREFADDTDT